MTGRERELQDSNSIMKLTRRQFLQLSSVVGGMLLVGERVPVAAALQPMPTADTGFEFPLEFPIAFSPSTELHAQPSSTTLLSLRSLSFWERLFNLK
jgi:hypothetical protein